MQAAENKKWCKELSWLHHLGFSVSWFWFIFLYLLKMLLKQQEFQPAQLPQGKELEQRARLWRCLWGWSLLWKFPLLLAVQRPSWRLWYWDAALFLSSFFQRDGSRGGNLYKREVGMGLVMGFGRIMQSPTNCVSLSQNLFSSSFLCLICQSPLKGQFRSLNAQKLKLPEAKVKSPHTQSTLGAAVQDMTGSPSHSQQRLQPEGQWKPIPGTAVL